LIHRLAAEVERRLGAEAPFIQGRGTPICGPAHGGLAWASSYHLLLSWLASYDDRVQRVNGFGIPVAAGGCDDADIPRSRRRLDSLRSLTNSSRTAGPSGRKAAFA